MNSLDKIVNDIQNLSASEILDRLGSEMYNEDFPERKELNNYPEFIQDAIFIIDFDTELSMEGICGVLENYISTFLPQIINALHNIGANNEAAILLNIYTTYQASPESEEIDDLSDKLYLYTDFDIWPLLETYIEQEKNKYITNYHQKS